MNQTNPTEGQKTRVFIVEDHVIVRQGLALLINREKDLTVMGEAMDAETAFRKIMEEGPDLVLLDLTLGDGLKGLQLIKDLRKAGMTKPILVLSMHDESVYAERVLRSGAQGYVMKAEATEKVLGAIRRVLSGQVYLSERMVGRVLHRIGSAGGEAPSEAGLLSDREMEVLHFLGSGLTTREIAGKLNLSVKTIETYREHIKDKLHLKNAAELVQHAVKWVQSQA